MDFFSIHSNEIPSLYKALEFSASCSYQGACQIYSLAQKSFKDVSDSMVSKVSQKNQQGSPVEGPNKKTQKKKKESHFVSYLLLGTASAATMLIIVNLWNRGTLRHGFCKTGLQDVVPVVSLSGDLGMRTPSFSPKSFLPMVVFAESLYFLKKATWGVRSNDLITLAQKSPIIASQYIQDFPKNVQNSIRKAVASALLCMKNTESQELIGHNQQRTALSAARMIYPDYEEEELAETISGCRKGVSWDALSARGYLQALELVQRTEKFLDQDDPVMARQLVSQIPKGPFAFKLDGIMNVQKKAQRKVDLWYFRHMDDVLTAYETAVVKKKVHKYGAFSVEKATELLQIETEMDGRSPIVKSQNVQRILRLAFRDLNPTEEVIETWNDRILSKGGYENYKDRLFPLLLQRVKIDGNKVDSLLKLWSRRLDRSQVEALSLVLLENCLHRKERDFFLKASLQIANSQYLHNVEVFLGAAADAFVNSYRGCGVPFNSATVEKIESNEKAAMLKRWLKALQDAFHKKSFMQEFNLLKNTLERKEKQQPGTYTYTCDNGDSIRCKGAKEECDNSWKAKCPQQQSSNTGGFNFGGFKNFFNDFGFKFSQGTAAGRSSARAQSQLKGVSEAIETYKKNPTQDASKHMGKMLFEYYLQLQKSPNEIQSSDVEQTLWPVVQGVLDAKTLKKAYRSWSLSAHPDKPGGSQEVFTVGSKINDCLNSKLDGKRC